MFHTKCTTGVLDSRFLVQAPHWERLSRNLDNVYSTLPGLLDDTLKSRRCLPSGVYARVVTCGHEGEGTVGGGDATPGSGFVGFCQNKIQGHSRTFQGLNFRIQGLFEWAQINLLTRTLSVLINIVASAVDDVGRSPELDSD